MSDAAEQAQDVAREAAALVPGLTERLKRHGLGEIEVRRGDLRIRVVADGAASSGSTTGGIDVTVSREGVGVTGASLASAPLDPITSPAVGYFLYADGLGPGRPVAAGTEIGFVEMLGIRHEVRATADGVVRHLVAESGEPVEYGQLLVELDRAGGG
jgi:acetyl-CoA carboxylase biotin carboxyl carrier protein